MARKFLYVIAGLIVLVIAGAVALRLFAEDLTEIALVPSAEFSAQPELEQGVYRDPAMWIARPDLGPRDIARWTPPGIASGEPPVAAAVFFVHPTSFVSRDRWNAPLDDTVSRQRAKLFVKGMASPFNRSPDVWAPRYRQAVIGAFLTDAPEATQALDLAYEDVAQSFEEFLRRVPADRPIVLAGHSQGAYHLRRLLKERIAGTPLARRIAAVYVIGWPVSIDHDLPAMGLPVCESADQAGCIVSWLSFADPADTDMLVEAYGRKLGLDGQAVGSSPFLCTNPITGTRGGAATAEQNLGTLVPDIANGTGTLAPRVVPAICGEDHFLHLGSPPALDFGPYVLPGNNYHLFDITLFWANLREDFARRVAAWQATR